MTGASAYHRVLAVAGFFTLAAGDVWRYALTWVGWGVIAGGLVVLCAIELVRRRVDPRDLPLPLIGFLLLTVASISWSFYPGASALGALTTLATAVFAVFAASVLDWSELLAAIGSAMRWALGASLLFELVVAVVVRQRVLPFWVDYSGLDRIPAALYWSRNLLFDGGRIQGIMGNANLLAMAALIGLIVFAIQLAAREITLPAACFWIAVAVTTLALTRAATVLVAAVAVAAVAVLVLVVRRTRGVARIVAHVGAPLVLVLGAGVAFLAREPLLALLDRSPDLTNRLDIWAKVVDLAVQRPVVGWGWVSYWAPWVEPYDDLVVIKGVHYYQAHDAWLDLFLQLGVVGLVVFAALALVTAARTWTLAVTAHADTDPGWPLALAAPLLCTALLVQSVTESRLLIEIGLAMLIVLAIASRRSLLADRAVGRETGALAASGSGTA